jgi:flagellar biosynthesis protein FlhG
MYPPSAAADQAAGLRRLFAGALEEYVPVVARRGTTAPVLANLACACARIGRRVLVVDATPGEVATALGLPARLELAHVLAGDRAVEQVIVGGGDGPGVLPATRGLAQSLGRGIALPEVLAPLESRYDLVLVHADPRVLDAAPVARAAATLLPVPATAGALTEAYVEVKRSMRRGERVTALLHGVATPAAATALFGALNGLARRFLEAEVGYAGFVPSDATLYRAVASRRSVFDLDPDSAAARALEQVAGLLGGRSPAQVH